MYPTITCTYMYTYYSTQPIVGWNVNEASLCVSKVFLFILNFMINLPQKTEEGSGSFTKENDIHLSNASKVDHAPVPLITGTESDGSAEGSEPLPTQTPPISPPTFPVTPQAAAVESTEGAGASPEAKSVYYELSHHSNLGIPAPPVGDEPQNQFKNPQVYYVATCIQIKNLLLPTSSYVYMCVYN